MTEFPITRDSQALPGSFTALPAWTYCNPTLLEREYQDIILPSWQFACHVSELAAPGDYLTFDLMRDSVIVMRGQDGGLQAFRNVCRHRGARLLDGAGRCKGSIVCPYHGWTYSLNGRLRALPAAQTFPGIDLARHSLTPVELEEFHGLVFVRLVPGGPSVAEIWGPLADLLAPYRLADREPSPLTAAPAEWACNWKVAVDNNLENYHVPIGHPGYHRLLDLIDDVQSPLGVFGTIATLKATPSSNWVERLYQQLAPEILDALPYQQRRTWAFFTMPPNLGLNIYPDSIDIYQVLPLTSETCQVRWLIYRTPLPNRAVRVLQALSYRINRQVGNEDRELSERVQKGLSSHGYEQGPLSTLEIALKDFHDRLADRIPDIRNREPPASFRSGHRLI